MKNLASRKLYTGKFKILDVLIFLLLALIFIPQFKFLTYYNQICLFVALGWFLIAFIVDYDFFLARFKYFKITISFFLIITLIPLLNGNFLIFNRYTSFFLIPIFYWFYSFNNYKRGNHVNLNIFYVSIIFILYTTINTIIGLINNPYAARSIKTSTEGSEELISNGISGYELIYSVVLISILLIPLLLERKRVVNFFLIRLLILILVLIFLYLIILSNYFTALIVSLLGCLFLIVVYRNGKYIYVVAPIFLFYFLFRDNINVFFIDFISNFTQSDGLTYKRLSELKNSIQAGSSTTSVDSRSEVMQQSVNLFLDNPILGYAFNSVENFDIDNLGQHSFILDTYALYGFFLGSISVFVFLYPFFQKFRVTNVYKLKLYSVIIAVSFILLITFNNLTASIGFAAFFVFPTLFDLIKIKNA